MRIDAGRIKTKDQWALYEARRERLLKMAALKAPPVLMAMFALPVVEVVHGGPWRALWWHFRQVLSSSWGYHAGRLWHFWHCKIRGRTHAEIEAMTFGEYEDEDEE